jgi:hypothetical protein
MAQQSFEARWDCSIATSLPVMKLSHLFCSIPVLVGLLATSGAAGLPETVKTQATQFDAAMKQYDASVAAQKKLALDQYAATLNAARRIEEGAKRAAGVAAIDAELAARKAGAIEGKTPAELPAHLGTARERFVTATKRAATSNDSVRKFTVDGYLKWLTELQAAHARAKDDATVTAIEAEKKRVAALMEAFSR